MFHGVGDDDPDGTNARYAWSFGDGTTLPDGGPNPRHTYNRPGAYKVTLTLTDDEGCSTALRLHRPDGLLQRLPCRHPDPGDQGGLPRRARPLPEAGRTPRLPGQAARGDQEAARQGRERGGEGQDRSRRRGDLSLKTKRAFATKLATAKKVLVEETLKIHGATRVRFVRLKIVR